MSTEKLYRCSELNCCDGMYEDNHPALEPTGHNYQLAPEGNDEYPTFIKQAEARQSAKEVIELRKKGHSLGECASYLRLQGYTAIRHKTASLDLNKPLAKSEDPIEVFNSFIEKWLPEHHAHLIDNDDNDGEEMRESIKGPSNRVSRDTVEEVRKVLRNMLFGQALADVDNAIKRKFNVE